MYGPGEDREGLVSYIQRILCYSLTLGLNREAFPVEHAETLRDLMVQLTAHPLATGRSKFILRQLFVAVRPSPNIIHIILK